LLNKIQNNFGPSDVIVDSYDVGITRGKIDCMRDGEWLSSEVEVPRNVHIWSSFRSQRRRKK